FELNPGQPDTAVVRSMWNGKMQPVIPGSSLKGVFRNRAEKYFPDCCNINKKASENKCYNKSRGLKKGKKIYEAVCESCRLFGCRTLRGRAEFSDAFPVEETVKINTRYQVAIDRLTGAAKKNALFEFEVVEAGTFKAEILIRNFSSKQLKVLLQVIQDINDGYVRLGSSTSRGFGRIKAENVVITCRDYTKPGNEIGQFFEKEYDLNACLENLSNISINNPDEVSINEIPCS
ncbi:MAG: CRISPR-associated protein, partial [Clostridiaceae bacterium]|nr:CRISPR-associated protein [Clostridiaceae bacterium]